jgi:hypothetical protein
LDIVIWNLCEKQEHAAPINITRDKIMNNESGGGDCFLIVTGYLDKIDVLIDEVLLTNILQKRT